MSYVKDNLMPNEKILFSARVSPAVLFPATIAFMGRITFVIYAIITISQKNATSEITGWVIFLISGMFFLLTIKIGLEAIFIMLTTEFSVTNRRVIAKTSVINRPTLEMLLGKIESIAVYQ